MLGTLNQESHYSSGNRTHNEYDSPANQNEYDAPANQNQYDSPASQNEYNTPPWNTFTLNLNFNNLLLNLINELLSVILVAGFAIPWFTLPHFLKNCRRSD